MSEHALRSFDPIGKRYRQFGCTCGSDWLVQFATDPASTTQYATAVDFLDHMKTTVAAEHAKHVASASQPSSEPSTKE